MGVKGGNPNPVILIVFVAIIWFCMGYAPYYTISQAVAINNMQPKKKYEKDSPLATLLTKVTFYLVLIGSVSCVCLFVANVCAKIRSDKKQPSDEEMAVGEEMVMSEEMVMAEEMMAE